MHVCVCLYICGMRLAGFGMQGVYVTFTFEFSANLLSLLTFGGEQADQVLPKW